MEGSLNHNNRTFVAENVDKDRLSWNVTYKKESLEEAYEKCFGDAIREYNAKQKRKDRQKHDYISEIRNSKNKEKVFYENVIMIGSMKDTGVTDGNGRLTISAGTASQILDQYAKNFQERNPNLYLFNAVLHMDEATPHLHLDYIPVASGCYKTGLKTRNSLTKALQGMGFEKAKGKYENETMAWQEREREYISGLCLERGIEIVPLEEKRASLTLPEYKEAMKEIEELQEQAVELRDEQAELKEDNELLKNENTEIALESEKLEKKNSRLNKEIQKSAALRENFERDVWKYWEAKEWQLPEPGFAMSAKSYKEKKAEPLVGKLKNVIEKLTLKCANLMEEIKKLKNKLSRFEDKVIILENRVLDYAEENQNLKETQHDLDLLKHEYGYQTIESEVSRLRQREVVEKQKHRKVKRIERDSL